MAEDSTLPSGWLPPQAPGAKPPPRFEPSAPEPQVAPEAPSASESESESVRGWTPPAPPREGSTDAATATPQAAPAGVGNGLATASLVLGIAGVAVLVITLGIGTLLSLPLSVGAWVCASKARGKIQRGETAQGWSNARAGRILGIVGVGLALAALVVWAALDAAGYTLDDLRESIERELERQRDSEG